MSTLVFITCCLSMVWCGFLSLIWKADTFNNQMCKFLCFAIFVLSLLSILNLSGFLVKV